MIQHLPEILAFLTQLLIFAGLLFAFYTKGKNPEQEKAARFAKALAAVQTFVGAADAKVRALKAENNWNEATATALVLDVVDEIQKKLPEADQAILDEHLGEGGIRRVVESAVTFLKARAGRPAVAVAAAAPSLKVANDLAGQIEDAVAKADASPDPVPAIAVAKTP